MKESLTKRIWKNNGFQTFFASIICIILGLVIGYIVLLFINPSGAFQAIISVIKNFFNFSKSSLQLKNLGNTLAKTAPLLMCALSILFCYKVGLFNIGVAGQYCAGICASLYAALAWHWSWWLCMLFAMAVGGFFGFIVGILKAYCNVNEVISGIMLNWIILYGTNMVLTSVKEETSPYTFHLSSNAPESILPTLGLDKLFTNNQYVTIAIPLSIIIAVIILIVLNKTKIGYELKATGINKNAAKYAGMAEKRNIILTLIIGGFLAGLGASFLYQTDYEQWMCTTSSVPGMGFNGIAAAFLGGLNPIGTILSSYFIQHITAGGTYVDKTLYCSQISDLISSLIIYLCGFVLFIKHLMNKIDANKTLKAKNNVSNDKKAKGGDQ